MGTSGSEFGQTNDLAQVISTLVEELANDPGNHRSPAFGVTVEWMSRDLDPILRDETHFTTRPPTI